MTLLNITSWRNNGSKQLHEKIKTKFKVNDKIKLLNFQIFLPLTRGGVAFFLPLSVCHLRIWNSVIL